MQTGKVVLVSLRLLVHQWRRTFTTALAFAVGLGCFGAFAGITAAAHAQFLRIVEQRGVVDVLTIVPAQFRMMGGREVQVNAFRSLTLPDVDALRAAIGGRAVVAPVRMLMTSVRWRRHRETVTLIGTTADYFTATATPVADGSVWTDDRKPAAVITRDTATAIFEYQDPLGMRIYIGERPFVIRGLLPSKAAQGADLRVIVPLRWAPAADVDRDRVSQIIVRVNDPANRGTVMRDAAALLRRRHRLGESASDDFTIRDESALLRAETQVNELLRLLLPAVSGVTLAIGGIGIVGVMLLAIRERSAEIGLRRAAGASRRDVVLQFVIEAWLIACPAALIGEGMGALAAVVIAEHSGWPAALDWPLLLLAIGVAAGLATLCSIGPAFRAARLDPVVALRTL
jgi:putative ABC transport system permease protein